MRACGVVSLSVCAELTLAREPHSENMIMLVGEGYNGLACWRGCAASLSPNLRSMGRQTQSWSQRLLKGTASCQKSLAPVLLSLPPVLPLSAAPPSLPFSVYPFIFFHSVKLFLHSNLEAATPPLLPSVLACARCKSTWHCLSKSCSGTVRGSHARALESSFTH